LPCLNTFVELRDFLHGLSRPEKVSPRLQAALKLIRGQRPPLWARLPAAIKRSLQVRVPAVWLGATMAATAMLAWVVFVPGNRSNETLSRSGVSSRVIPTTVTELAGRDCSTVPESKTSPVTPLPGKQGKVSTTSSGRRSLPELVEELQNGIVVVMTLDKERRPLKCGSGFFINPNGLLLTSYHIIEQARGFVVKLPNGAFFEMEQIMYVDPQIDFAMLKVAGRNLPALKLGDSNSARVGDEVIALGNPLGLEISVSTGIISGRRGDGHVLLQTTAPISEGSSGGPLLNTRGEVIGITISSASGGQNLNFAIAINDVKSVQATSSAKSDVEKALNAYFAGIVYLNNKDYEKAKESLLKATQLDPKNVDAWLDLGDAYYKTGERDKEGAAYKKALELRPTSDDAHYLLGTWYQDRGEFDAAAQEFRAAIQLDPKNEDALYDLALLHLIGGRRAEATQAYHQLKSLNPGLGLKLLRILELSDKARAR
jgi:S1-C subfamily serine protease/predicted TPR repeat methyltransferase